jgi:hypothetical protein
MFAGREREARRALLRAPGNHGFDGLAGDSATAVAGFGIDIEDGGAAAFKIVGVSGPGRDKDGASGDHALSVASEPSTKGSVRDRSVQVRRGERRHRLSTAVSL